MKITQKGFYFYLIISLMIVLLLLVTSMIITSLNECTQASQLLHSPQKERFDEDSSSTIPRVIWSFWDGEMPDLVKRCIQSWQHYNPSYLVIVLDKNSLSKYLNVDIGSLKFANHSPWAKSSAARFSDYVRLNLLARYGGIWMDATIICHKPLDWIYSHPRDELVGFYFDKFSASYPLVESWFLACKKGSLFMKNWCDEFMSVNTYESIDDYIESIKNLDIDISGIPPRIQNYLCVYISCQKILQENPSKYKIYLEKSEDGPSKFLYDNDFDVEKSMAALLTKKYNNTKIIKLRSQEKWYIIKNNVNINPLFEST